MADFLFDDQLLVGKINGLRYERENKTETLRRDPAGVHHHRFRRRGVDVRAAIRRSQRRV
jgi:hypothetical protein